MSSWLTAAREIELLGGMYVRSPSVGPGAPMGIYTDKTIPPTDCWMFDVTLIEGGYTRTGHYFGALANGWPLFCAANTAGFRAFCRSPDKARARGTFMLNHPDLSWSTASIRGVPTMKTFTQAVICHAIGDPDEASHSHEFTLTCAEYQRITQARYFLRDHSAVSVELPHHASEPVRVIDLEDSFSAPERVEAVTLVVSVAGVVMQYRPVGANRYWASDFVMHDELDAFFTAAAP